MLVLLSQIINTNNITGDNKINPYYPCQLQLGLLTYARLTSNFRLEMKTIRQKIKLGHLIEHAETMKLKWLIILTNLEPK